MFLILSFLIGVAIVNCAPQGYNYYSQQQHGSSIQSGLNIRTSSNFHTNQAINNPLENLRIPAPVNSLNDHQTFFQEAIPQFGNLLQAPAQHFNGDRQPQHNIDNAPPVVTKDIYIHAAPEEPEEQYSQSKLPNLPPRKHYRIVFIKAPTQNIKQQSIRLSQAPTEEKTIIYVLSKKDDPIDIQEALQNIQPTQPSKPEVYFIKYKTQEEAAHAQKQIQGKFTKL
ncbi:hypothetical protein ACFFRR_005794 [Megaselia abdita]